MAVKGQEQKEQIYNKLKEIYPNAEIVEKVLRIPFVVDGEPLEIKVALTAAKDVVLSDAGGGSSSASDISSMANDTKAAAFVEPSQQEKENLARMLANLI